VQLEHCAVDYLLHSPEDRAGALSFGRGKVAPAPTRHFNRVVKLGALLRFADAMDPSQTAQSSALAVQLEGLLQPGTSLGGARPKSVVEDDDGLFVAKFPAKGDRWNFARVERPRLHSRVNARFGHRAPVSWRSTVETYCWSNVSTGNAWPTATFDTAW
jgi:hypothetical protein